VKQAGGICQAENTVTAVTVDCDNPAMFYFNVRAEPGLRSANITMQNIKYFLANIKILKY